MVFANVHRRAAECLFTRGDGSFHDVRTEEKTERTNGAHCSGGFREGGLVFGCCRFGSPFLVEKKKSLYVVCTAQGCAANSRFLVCEQLCRLGSYVAAVTAAVTVIDASGRRFF